MIINESIYDGSLIHARFAYKYFRDKTSPTGNIVAFRAPMKVEAAGMIDSEDLLTNDYIYSDYAVNFCWEIPNLDPFGAVCFQRLFNTQLANILSTVYLKAPIEVDGDDLIVHKEHNNRGILQPRGKASVSITYSKNNVALGHTAINIYTGNQAPVFAYSTDLSNDQATAFMQNGIDIFNDMTKDIFKATTKVIC